VKAGIDPASVVDEAFEAWYAERNNIGPDLFPGVISTLKELKSRGMKLCAITNGNARLKGMPQLAELLEFCISAEMVGHRKPDSQPFEEAAKAAGLPGLESIDAHWVHVGDDFGTDCVGAKAVGMRTILVHPPHRAEEKKNETKKRGIHISEEDEDEDDYYNTDNDTVAGKEPKEPGLLPPSGGEITLSMGASWYVADGVMSDFVDAECYAFGEILAVIDDWNSEAAAYDDKIAIITGAHEAAANVKFCTDCGTKLPPVAKFCTECGSKQSQKKSE
jgi:HAD superfamily hydrolase (TIGR01549 family)